LAQALADTRRTLAIGVGQHQQELLAVYTRPAAYFTRSVAYPGVPFLIAGAIIRKKDSFRSLRIIRRLASTEYDYPKVAGNPETAPR